MSLLTTLLTYYYKFGLEDRMGLVNRQPIARAVAEGFYRRSLEPGYDRLLADLLDPLDDDASRAVVRKVIARHHYIFQNNLLQHRYLYDAAELANRPILRRELPKLAAAWSIPLHLTEASVLWYHHGLRHTDLPVAEFAARFATRDIIDVGAASGDSTCVFHQHHPCRHIHAFEPRPTRIPVLRSVLTRHHFDRITIVESGLGPAKGSLPDGSPMLALDDYVAQTSIEVGLIKMDVEGFESTVLAGAARTLREQRPLLIVSMYHNAGQFFDLLPQIRSMQPGYRFAIRKLDDRSPVFETTLFAW